MTRRKEIDKEKVLDAAEAVILGFGGRSFTLDAVAERAGISKGGLVYTFATKDILIHAALEREMARFQSAIALRVGSGPITPAQLVLAYIDEALSEDEAATQKAAFLITALVQAPDMLEPIRRLYRSLLDPLQSADGASAEIRHALLAVEGIFLLKALGFVEVTQDELKSDLLHARDAVVKALTGASSASKAELMLEQVGACPTVIQRPLPPGRDKS